MRSVVASFVALAASSAFAHGGHGATPAHVHVGGAFPVDIGALVFVVVGCVGVAVALRARAR
jgi:hypothetical protein